MGDAWLAAPRAWLGTFGDLSRFGARVLRDVLGGRVLSLLGEALRQAGILILSSTLVIWGIVFIIGLQCGIEGAYFTRSVGSPAYAGVFAAWCVRAIGMHWTLVWLVGMSDWLRGPPHAPPAWNSWTDDSE